MTAVSINAGTSQTLQRHLSGTAKKISFYLSGDPDARWVGATEEHASFGIAFDLLGDGTRILVAQRPAAVASLAIRPPERHPGALVKYVMLGIKVDSTLTLAD